MYVEVHERNQAPKSATRAVAPRVPEELKEAEALLERYGRWAQDRYQKRRCASAEGQYRAPTNRDDEPMQGFMPDWCAMHVQHTLVVVPMQYRRVLQAYYIPQRRPHHAIRRELNIKTSTWELSRIEGLRQFWSKYRLRHPER